MQPGVGVYNCIRIMKDEGYTFELSLCLKLYLKMYFELSHNTESITKLTIIMIILFSAKLDHIQRGKFQN